MDSKRIIVALSLLFPIQHAFGAGGRVDFDEGPNASTLLNAAREAAGVTAPAELRTPQETFPSARLAAIGVPAALKLAAAPPPSDSPTLACESYIPENDGRPSALTFSCREAEKHAECANPPTLAELIPEQFKNLAIAPGSVFGGPFGPKPRGGSPYIEGLGLKNRLESAPSIPAETLGALLKDWREIDATATRLESDGNGLDVEDGALYTDAVRINHWSDRIQARLAILRRLASDYNQRCRSGPLPPGEVTACNQWAARYNTCVDRHNASVKRYEQAVAAWNADYDRLEPRVSGFLARIRDWEATRIKPFITLARQALDGCDKLVGMRIDPARPPLLPAGGAKQDFHATPAFAAPGTNACKVTYLWTTTNTNGNIGSIAVSPQTERHATLTTGDDSAEGSVQVEGVDISGAKASSPPAPVKVVKGALQCQVTGTQCLPDAGGQFKLICTYNCCGSTEIADPVQVPSCGAPCPIRFCAP